MRENKNAVPTVKHGSGSNRLRVSFLATDMGEWKTDRINVH